MGARRGFHQQTRSEQVLITSLYMECRILAHVIARAGVRKAQGGLSEALCQASGLRYGLGCVSSRGVGSLCFLSPKMTVNTEVYIDLLDAYLLPSVDKLFADDDFVFQHDLAPAHRSYKTAKYLKEKRIDVLEWPCNSPDLNIIQFVW